MFYIRALRAKKTSFQLVSLLPGHKIILTNSLDGVSRDIEMLNNGYEKIIMFGTDKALFNAIRLEKAAEKDSVIQYSKADFAEYSKKAEALDLCCILSERPNILNPRSLFS